jgi:polar amino acid transport system substrate-binding protein
MTRRAIAVFASLILFCAWTPLGGHAAETLRFCADPDNLPFSSSTPGDPGLYVELGEKLAGRIGVRAEYFWWASYFGKRTVRNTLLSDRCDAYVGLPFERDFMGRSLAMTRPFLDVGYVIVAPRSLALARLDDLRGTSIGVQFGSQPQVMLAAREFPIVTFRTLEQVMDAVGRGEVGTAFVWGPAAGYYNKTRLAGAYQIVPVAGEGLQWKVAIGVRKGDDALRARLDDALGQLRGEILALADKYGFPLAEPVDLNALASPVDLTAVGVAGDFNAVAPRADLNAVGPTVPLNAVGPRVDLNAVASMTDPGSRAPDSRSRRIRLVAADAEGHFQSQDLVLAQEEKTNPFKGDADAVRAGRSVFNQHCAHCHSPNAMNPEPRTDLRRLKRRYGDNMGNVALQTITDGRVANGMPPWKEILSEEAIWKIMTFLESVQSQP